MNQPRQNSTTAALPSTLRPSGAGDVSSNTVSSLKSVANLSASCRLNALLNLSIVFRVVASCDCPACSELIETSGVAVADQEPPNRNNEHITRMLQPFAFLTAILQ